MAAKMALARVSRWRSHLLVAVSVPVLGAPFLSTVKADSLKVHPRELDIYDPVEQSQDTTNPTKEEITEFEQKVSVARKFIWGWTSGVKDGVAKVRSTFASVEEKSLEFVELIRTDMEFQLKVGGISAAVLGGAILAGRGRRPIRRIFYSAVLGTTATAICYPKQAVDITLANFDRLKEFIKEQRHKFNQRRAEQAALKELESPVEETEISKDEDKPAEDVAEDVAEEVIVELKDNQAEVSDVQQEIPKQEVVAEEKPKTSFWSNIPFVDKFIGSKESVTKYDVNPVTASEGESKDQVIVQAESTSQAKIEGDIGQSNPEDKDMYSTRS